MPSFSKRSRRHLDSCHPALQTILLDVVRHFDCTVLVGHRGRKAQNEAFRTGHSKLDFPNSKHNVTPSLAVDVVPYPIDWSDTQRMNYFAGHVMMVAAVHGVRLRWGGDWDRDTQVKDNGFDDLAHFEIV